MSAKWVLFILILLAGCVDVWTDRTYNLDSDFYIIYSEGDRYRLAKKISSSNYSDLLSTTISDVYMDPSATNKNFVIKADPQTELLDTCYFSLLLANHSYRLDTISKADFDKMTQFFRVVRYKK